MKNAKNTFRMGLSVLAITAFTYGMSIAQGHSGKGNSGSHGKKEITQPAGVSVQGGKGEIKATAGGANATLSTKPPVVTSEGHGQGNGHGAEHGSKAQGNHGSKAQGNQGSKAEGKEGSAAQNQGSHGKPETHGAADNAHGSKGHAENENKGSGSGEGSHADPAANDFGQARAEAARNKSKEVTAAAETHLSTEEQHVLSAKDQIKAAQAKIDAMKADPKADKAVIAQKEAIIQQAQAKVDQLDAQIKASKAVIEKAKALAAPAASPAK